MPIVAVVALAILSLFAGALMERPAARAAEKSQPASPAGKADAADFKVVSEDLGATGTRFVAVVLPHRIAEPEIERIADRVRAREKQPFERTVVNFYLPGMKIGRGAWAVAAFQPALRVTVVGLRLDEEQTAIAEVAADRRKLVGVWLTSPPAPPGRLTIYAEGGAMFAEWRLRDGTKSVEKVTESRDRHGRVFSPASGGTTNYVLTGGGLELRDGTAVIATGEPLPVTLATPAEVAAAAATAAPKAKVAKASSGARKAQRAAATASAVPARTASQAIVSQLAR